MIFHNDAPKSNVPAFLEFLLFQQQAIVDKQSHTASTENSLKVV